MIQHRLRRVSLNRSPSFVAVRPNKRLSASQAPHPSPYARPIAGAKPPPPPPRLDKEAGERLEAELPSAAQEVLRTTQAAQVAALRLPHLARAVDWIQGRHFVIAGGSSGIGFALANAIAHYQPASLLMISADRTKGRLGRPLVLPYFVGQAFENAAHDKGLRYYWTNDGLEVTGPQFENIRTNLQALGAQDVIFIHCVAMASSGVLEGHPPVYVRYVDEAGELIEEPLGTVTPKQIEASTHIMGHTTYLFADALEQAGIRVAQRHTCDWRGSQDSLSRHPESPFYGRQGAYSTSLWQPKAVIQERVLARAAEGKKDWIDHWLPVMRTRALGLIPGGNAMANLYQHLMRMHGIRWIDVPELALMVLDRIRLNVENPSTHEPFALHDAHERPLDEHAWPYTAALSIHEYSHLRSPDSGA